MWNPPTCLNLNVGPGISCKSPVLLRSCSRQRHWHHRVRLLQPRNRDGLPDRSRPCHRRREHSQGRQISVAARAGTTRADVSMFSSTKLDAPNSRAVATLPRLVESPTTTTGASGKLAFDPRLPLASSSRTVPTKRMPFRGTILISRISGAGEQVLALHRCSRQ